MRRCAPACVLLHGACAPLRLGPCPHRAWTDNSDLCSMVTRWAEASTPRILFLLWRRQWSWTGAKPADADTMPPAWRNSQQPQIAVTGRVPPPASRRGAQVAAARARGWPAGRGRRGGSGKLLAWLRMNFSFQKRALELKGAIQSVCWGAPCPQRGSGWAPECRPGKGRPCVPGAPVPEPGGGGGQLDTVELSIKVGSGCLSLEG